MARQFMTTNFEPYLEHLYSSMEDDVKMKHCLVCDGDCKQPELVPDVFVAGVPCKPYSLQRSKRFATGSVKNHEAFDTTFVEFFKWLDIHDPRSGLLENVMGLDQPEDRSSDTTPLDLLLEFQYLHLLNPFEFFA